MPFDAKAYKKKYHLENQEKIRERSRKWSKDNPERVRDRSLRKLYGITLPDYNRMLEGQKGLCAVCFQSCSTGKNLCVDHCHDTGRVRGLLCLDCNNGIGRLKDDVMLLQSAINYLKEYE